MSHRLQATHRQEKQVTQKKHHAPRWPSYKGKSQFVGTSPSGRVTVFVDPSLGDPGLQNAQDLVNDADRVVAANDQIFGTPGDPVAVMIFALDGSTDGSAGADHGGCDYTTGAAIEVCASFGSPGIGVVRGRAERVLDGREPVRHQHRGGPVALVRGRHRQ